MDVNLWVHCFIWYCISSSNKRVTMKTTIDGKELWTVEEIVNSDLKDSEKFTITLAELRRIDKTHKMALKRIDYLSVENELMKQNIKEHSRFVVSA